MVAIEKKKGYRMYNLRKKKNRFHVLKDKMKEAGTSHEAKTHSASWMQVIANCNKVDFNCTAALVGCLMPT